jgi:hypothetical protein
MIEEEEINKQELQVGFKKKKKDRKRKEKTKRKTEKEKRKMLQTVSFETVCKLLTSRRFL